MKHVTIAILVMSSVVLPVTGTDYIYHEGYYWLGSNYYRYVSPYYQYGRYYPGSYVYVGTYTAPASPLTTEQVVAALHVQKLEEVKAVSKSIAVRKTIEELWPNGQLSTYSSYQMGYHLSYHNTQSQGTSGYSFNQQVQQPDVNVWIQGVQRNIDANDASNKIILGRIADTASDVLARQDAMLRYQLAAAIMQGGPKSSTQSGVLKSTPAAVVTPVQSIPPRSQQSQQSSQSKNFDDQPSETKL
jgi:hypothetical protein